MKTSSIKVFSCTKENMGNTNISVLDNTNKHKKQVSPEVREKYFFKNKYSPSCSEARKKEIQQSKQIVKEELFRKAQEFELLAQKFVILLSEKTRKKRQRIFS